MKLIKSLEQLLYELMVWVVFYPRTMVLAVLHPMKLMEYATQELDDEDSERYSDTLSPPIFLAISLALVHFVELAGGLGIAEGTFADDRNLLAFRLVVFSLFPLMLAIRALRAQGLALDRNLLQAPFYAQCFVAAPFAFGIDEAIVLGLTGHVGWSLVVLAVTLVWYTAVQTLWFRRELGTRLPKSLAYTLWAFFNAAVCMFALTVAVSRL